MMTLTRINFRTWIKMFIRAISTVLYQNSSLYRLLIIILFGIMSMWRSVIYLNKKSIRKSIKTLLIIRFVESIGTFISFVTLISK